MVFGAAIAFIAIAGVYIVAVVAEEYLLFVPLAILGIAGILLLFQYPVANLVVLLCSVVLALNFEPGFQLTEVLFGLYYAAFMAVWFARTALDPRKRVIGSTADVLLTGFLIYVAASFVLTLLFGGDLRTAISEYVALSMLGFYFPVRDFCREHYHGARTIVWIIAAIGVFVAVRNLMIYTTRLGNVEHMYQIMTGRVIINDNVLMVASVAGLVLVLFSERLRNRGFTLVIFLVILMGLVFTQSRAFWVTFVFCAMVLFVIIEMKYKRRMAVLLGAGLLCFLTAGLVLFGDLLSLILTALIDRMATIGSAAESDISLRSRGYEALAVIERIIRNPVMGHGVGVSFDFFDVIDKVTKVRTFIHNAYVSLLYRFGLIGFLLMLAFWLLVITRSVHVARKLTQRRSLRVGALVASVALTGFLLSANASNPFFLMDALFMFGVAAGLGAGTYERSLREHGGA